MYRQLKKTFKQDPFDKLFNTSPLKPEILLEMTWAYRTNQRGDLGNPDRRSSLSSIGQMLPPSVLMAVAGVRPQRLAARWDHLIYAYMIENTRVYEIFERVLQEYVLGEKLGVPLSGAVGWLRNTEALFYKNPPPFSIRDVSSDVRPDLRSTRRNAYHRMFGMPLNHGKADGSAYPFHQAKAHNADFVTTFEEFLREVWVGIANERNTIGPNPADDAAIGNLAEKLHNMLLARRVNGNLSREEFYAVTMMSWFHLTLEENHPIIESLRAEANSAEQRLFKIAERVGLPAHGNSRSFFVLADPMSRLLTYIEVLTTFDSDTARTFYLTNGGTNQIPSDMRTIITHWSIVSGRDMKTRKTQVTK